MSQNHKDNPIPLKDAIRNIAEQNTLSDDRVEELLNLQKISFQDSLVNSPENQSIENPKNNLVQKTSLFWVASVAIISVFSVILIFWNNTYSDYTEQIALEVVENHLKLKPLDVQSQSMSDMRRYFNQLDFSLIQSSVLKQGFSLGDENLLGGRYCSIKGVTAAQLRYQVSKNNLSNIDLNTFYQVAYNPKLHGKIPDIHIGDKPKILRVKGLDVSLWLEKGLLMVLVQG